ncbi:MAG: YdeI/OmpD-associated family protein [Spirochaetales bacterium]|nr:YdeI/OmpD-associated family protein [Spirochaetales bacterium]
MGKKKLKESGKAGKFFYNLNKRSQNTYCLFITEPKKEETRMKRLNEMIQKLEQHWTLPYFRYDT